MNPNSDDKREKPPFLPRELRPKPITGAPNPGPRNGRCPLCNSGRKYKKCHGAPPMQADYDQQSLAKKASAAFAAVLQGDDRNQTPASPQLVWTPSTQTQEST